MSLRQPPQVQALLPGAGRASRSAALVGPVVDVVLDIEPVLNAEARRDLGEDAHHEGELTAAHRLIDRLHQTYGNFIDALDTYKGKVRVIRAVIRRKSAKPRTWCRDVT